MAQKHYIDKWERSQKDLTRMLRVERPLKPPPLPKDIHAAFADIAVRYVKYTTIYQKLEKCYDYMVQPQKRILIGRCLEGVSGRLVELREELVRVELNEYSYLGGVCQDMKITLPSLDMSLSKSQRMERVAKIRKREQMLDYILSGMKTTDQDYGADEDVYTIEEAVLLLQKNERGFQGRLRWKVFRKKGRGKKTVVTVPLDKLSRQTKRGILMFQSLWRGHRDRKRMTNLRRDMDISLGMMLPEKIGASISVMENAVKSNRHKVAMQNDDNLVNDRAVCEHHLKEERGPAMVADMRAEIMQWMLECRSLTNEWPQYPDPKDGGSALLFANKTIEQLTEDMEILQEELAKGKAKKKEKKKEKKKPAKKGKKKPPEEFIMRESKFVTDPMTGCVNDYSNVWAGRQDVVTNPTQTHDRSLMMEDVEAALEGTLREEVDKLMRIELERLTKGIDKKQLPKSKGKKAKGKSSKSSKKGRKGKKNKMKDLTPGVSTEDLFKELVIEGIIKKVDDVPLSDFVGSYNMISPHDSLTVESLPDLADIRKMVFDYGILPMSSANVHLKAPLVKSLLLVGPKQSGKKMLVNALCFELGATLFDLSPENVVDKYEGKTAQKLLLNMVYKVAKAMEPSVLFIDNCDWMFTKKLPQEVKELKPARLKAELTKTMKVVGPEDRILLIGSTKFPFKAKVKPLFKTYQRPIFLYPPTHGSRYMLWDSMIRNNHGVMDDKFSLSNLAKLSQGFTAGIIHAVVREVLTERRKSKQHIYPLRGHEFVARLALYDPVFRTELEAFRDWLRKTPNAKKLKKIRDIAESGKETIGLY